MRIFLNGALFLEMANRCLDQDVSLFHTVKLSIVFRRDLFSFVIPKGQIKGATL